MTTDDPTGRWTPDFSSPVPDDVLPVVPGVRLEEKIGRGGYAAVYRARQLSVDRDVAVKVDDRRLLDDRDKRRFTREIVAAGAVSAHPHIVTVYDGGTTADAHPYLVMELYPGGSYADRIRRSGPVPASEVVDVGLAIADALAAAHSDGILHRDVKPGNILISRYGSSALADFGLAALPRAAEGFSVTMESLTPSYAPPEAFSGSDPTAAMDIYSLGATLYALLLGRAPRSDRSGTAPPLARLLFLLNDPLPLPDAPDAATLMPIIWRATAFRPEDRYPSAAAMRDDLALVKAGRPASSVIPVGTPHTRPFTTGNPGVPAVGSDGGRDPDPSSSGPLGLFAARPEAAPRESDTRAPRSRRWIGAAAAVVAILFVAGLVVFGGRSSTGGVASAGTSARTHALVTDLSGLAPTHSATSPVTRGTPSPTRTAPTSSSARSASPTPIASSARSLSVPVAGSCWGGLVDISGTKTARQIPCSEPHYWEAYAAGLLDPSTPTPYDDDVAKDKVVKQICTQKALKSYVGANVHGTFNIDVVPPRELAFAQGDRAFYCVASRDGAGEVTGSVRAG
ncbi:Serine/threonine protein kinase [Nakamurella panacisegetis]|uniref:non-specific serine/threonine protein kinase n=1 Tax=Nakamurella panacisegetis TaxID=1090615 RepID=A0A1H0RRT9_9ACTN|nr:serine/threonine-protein kinase [Nakamurella panacisegetis]SDP32079.1 Serine/threonine protein kinase [Nakamurella panacisegetis]